MRPTRSLTLESVWYSIRGPSSNACGLYWTVDNILSNDKSSMCCRCKPLVNTFDGATAKTNAIAG